MIKFNLNHQEKYYNGDENLSLLTWLREHENIFSLKDGCSGQGVCGACLVQINNKPILACQTSMKKIKDADIITIEGIDSFVKDTLAKAFVHQGAVQCGFCTPGFLMRTKILLDNNECPDVNAIKKAFAPHLCRCTGYTKIIDAVMFASKAFKDKKEIKLIENVGLGKNRPKHDAYFRALGQKEFIDDMRFSDMLFGALKFSDHPRAEVLNINIEKAESFPGVVKVFTGKDIPCKRITGHIIQDWPLMVIKGETTRYIGDVLAGVVAENEQIARDAVKLIKVDYKILEPVTDPVKALINKIKIHEKGNLLSNTQFKRGGDIDKAFESCAYTVSATYKTQLVEHGFIESETSIARPIKNNKIQVYTQSQGIYDDRREISNILGIPKKQVVVTLVPCGGAFGGKEDLTVQGHAAVFSHHLKKPVKVSLSREESIRMHVKRHPFVMKYKIGCNEKGMLRALSADITGDTGAYASLGSSVLERAAGHAAGGYHVPVVDVVSRAVYTNNLPAGAMRGFGVNQVTFAVECLIDELCEKGNFDFWQFRYDNALKKGSLTATGQVLGDGVGLRQTLLSIKDDYYNAKYAGLAIAIKNVGFGNGLIDKSEVKIEIVSHKKIILHHGWTEMGQGIDTIAKQILFDLIKFKKDVEIKVISSTDSEVVGGATTASRGTFLLGNAIINAAEKLKKELVNKSLKELVNKKFKGEWLCDWTINPEKKNVKNPITHFSYGYAAQVVILNDNGGVEKVVAAHDGGRVINPKLFEGQIEGGVMMGLGYAFTEELKLDKAELVSARMAKLKIPKIKSMPEIVVKPVEIKDPLGPFGAKGIGEIGLVPTAPAAVNALYQFDGIRRYKLPVGRKIR
ncbi:MAG: selenium-dependent xanthine dehydrogenase [Desulfobacteraceae bacterium 4572_130]|nr:MAG: selenium-dependent xanthine dehydrogenase [Desulfobacteraceae bacterium 4572_130]